MREVEQYRGLAEKIHAVTLEYYNSFPWVQSMSDAQRAAHRVTHMANVDCHNGYLSGIIQKLAGLKSWRLQHQSYNKVEQYVSQDSENRRLLSDVPAGALFTRETFVERGRDSVRPIGKLVYQMRGSLFRNNGNGINNICKCSVAGFGVSWFHPYYWGVPSVEQILNTFKFAKQSEIDRLNEIHNPKGGNQ